MSRILVVERVELPHSATSTFERLILHGLPTWNLPPGTHLVLGAPVRIPLTLPPALGGQTVEILGRVDRVGPGMSIIVQHYLPWHGRIRLSVKPSRADSDGSTSASTVTIAVELNDEIVHWAQQLLVPVPQAQSPDTWRIGLIASGSGPASIFSVSVRNTATLAVEEINADGGVAGRQLELLFGDDGTHPGLGAAELVRLIHSGCRVVLANVTSGVFAALEPVARRFGVLIVHTVLNEGGRAGEQLLRLGERPAAQAEATIPLIMQATGGSRFFLAGNDYRWPRGAHRAVRSVIERHGGVVAGEVFADLGTVEFESTISAIDRSDADIVVSSFIGADEVAFEQQMYAAGMRERTSTLVLPLDESTTEFIGPDASEGLWTAFSYFHDLDTSENLVFKDRYRQRFGPGTPSVSSLTQGVYDSVHLVARAAAQVADWDPHRIGEALRLGVTYDGPRGRVRSGPYGLQQPIYVARARQGGLAPFTKVSGI